MSFAENLDVFFSNAEFADTVVVGSRTFQAIFDENFFDPEAGETLLETGRPLLTCKASDTVGLTRGVKLTVNGRPYTVIKREPDGTGTAQVLLSKLDT